MNYLYCGGGFCFDYLDPDYMQKAENDYRVAILHDPAKLLEKSEYVELSDHLRYVGPYYFESDGMKDTEIVSLEMQQIEKCTNAFFLLENGCCPGTVGELIYAAMLKKKITVFYLVNEEETESELHSACWYPLIMSRIIEKSVELIPCLDKKDAVDKILEKVELLKQERATNA